MSITQESIKTTTDGVTDYWKLFIGGRWVEPSTDARIEVVSPATEERVGSVAEAREADVDAAVAAAREAFDDGPWPRMTPAERGEALKRVSEEVQARVPEIAEAFMAEIGAPAELAVAFQQFAVTSWDLGVRLTSIPLEEDRQWEGGAGTVVREPVGVVAAVIPWNGPVGNASLKMAPALAAGCTMVIKPAPECPLGLMILGEALEAAGLPEGVVSILPAGREVGEYMVSHPDVDKVSFTGSTAAGRRVMQVCSEKVRPVTLELGGKSAGIIADDIPLDEVLPTLIPAGIGHSGQVCAAITRILVPEERKDEVVAAVAEAFEGIKVGLPDDPDTGLGPLVAERQRDRVENYIELGKAEGATVVTGGGRPPHLDKGWYVEPTLFADVTNDMRIAREEIFGPVICVLTFSDIDEAVAIANDSDYGLSGVVYAKDTELGEDIARRVRTGQIGVNTWTVCLDGPFGGYKESGIGREGGMGAMDAFLETKLVMKA
jgi:acyl-CoA reductase-like NAD-dependent aldehyde dehydrogenase